MCVCTHVCMRVHCAKKKCVNLIFDIIAGHRCECQRLFVMTSLMTCNTVTERAKMLSQWIQTAGELRVGMGNLYTFTSVMEALTSPQVRQSLSSDRW